MISFSSNLSFLLTTASDRTKYSLYSGVNCALGSDRQNQFVIAGFVSTWCNSARHSDVFRYNGVSVIEGFHFSCRAADARAIRYSCRAADAKAIRYSCRAADAKAIRYSCRAADAKAIQYSLNIAWHEFVKLWDLLGYSKRRRWKIPPWLNSWIFFDS